jgi:hypothetical protein
MAKSSEESFRPASIFSTLPTSASRALLSLPRSWAFFESFQTPGSSRALLTSSRRDFLAS